MSEDTNLILKVSNGHDKQRTYSKYMMKYKLAISNEFFLEALMIDYAMLEDRLIALLHYIGVVNRTSEKLSVTKQFRPQIRRLLGYKETSSIDIKSMSTKIKILCSFLMDDDTETDDYIITVRSHLSRRLDRKKVVDTLDEIIKWCNIRNQYVHALFNKNYDALQQDVFTYADKGWRLARQADNYVGLVSKNNNIRKKLKIK